ncbi:MAG: histidine kinase [Acidobacteriales bacterium]|nr:histidine kinase [Terriglobales bacterium]
MDQHQINGNIVAAIAPHWSRERLYRTLQLCGWYGHVGFITVIYLLAFPQGTWWRRFPAELLFATLGLLCSHSMRQVVRRWIGCPVHQLAWRLLLLSLAASAILVSPCMVLFSLVSGLANITASGANLWGNYIIVIYTSTTLLFTWLVIYSTFIYFERYRSAEREKLESALQNKEAQLRTMQAQMNPHFMFNCLNSIRAQTAEDVSSAQQMITALSQILRHTLKSAEVVPLREELNAVNAYLQLEKIRFEERLAFALTVDPATEEILIPPLLLQTLVENGIKHGLTRLPQGGEIEVVTNMSDGWTTIEVINSGNIGLAGESGGLGVKTSRERLRLVYGEDATLELCNYGVNRVRARIRIPTNKVTYAGDDHRRRTSSAK